MAGLEIHELDLLEKLITGDYSMDKRMMLKTTAADGDSVQSGYSMNDSTVMRLSRLSRISEINVDLDGRYFNRYLGDGLILSTPTGSTAYSLCRRSRGRSEARVYDTHSDLFSFGVHPFARFGRRRGAAHLFR